MGTAFIVIVLDYDFGTRALAVVCGAVVLRAGGRCKNLGVPVLNNLFWIEHFLKTPLYQIWEILGGPVAPLVPPALATILLPIK